MISFGAFAVLAYLRVAWPITTSVAAFFAYGFFVWGYSVHALRNVRYPSLDHLHRRKYAEVWDTLAASSSEARTAACGSQSESVVRESAAVPVKNITDLAGIHQDDNVLEIGCGVGRIGRELASRCASWTGTDISINMLAEARRRLSELPNVHLVRLEKTGLETLHSEAFDLVYSTNMFDHLDEIDRWLYVRDAFRVLRSGGRLYVDNIDIESERGWIAFARGAEVLGDLERPAFQPRPTTAAELATYARRAGFVQVSTHTREPLVILTARK